MNHTCARDLLDIIVLFLNTSKIFITHSSRISIYLIELWLHTISFLSIYSLFKLLVRGHLIKCIKIKYAHSSIWTKYSTEYILLLYINVNKPWCFIETFLLYRMSHKSLHVKTGVHLWTNKLRIKKSWNFFWGHYDF